MNERIKQLAEQAGALEVKSVLNIPKALSLNGAEIERFAELIIKECADYANWYQANSRYTDIAKAIKEHFGVEE